MYLFKLYHSVSSTTDCSLDKELETIQFVRNKYSLPKDIIIIHFIVKLIEDQNNHN